MHIITNASLPKNTLKKINGSVKRNMDKKNSSTFDNVDFINQNILMIYVIYHC